MQVFKMLHMVNLQEKVVSQLSESNHNTVYIEILCIWAKKYSNISNEMNGKILRTKKDIFTFYIV